MGGITYRSPRIVALALMVILAAGVSSLLSIGRQEDPTITNIFATITTPFPGADPARVEALVTAEIERELRAITEVDTISSSSAAGISIVSVELDETIDPGLIDGIWSEIRDKLSDAELTFPAGAQSPELETDANSGAYGAIVALTFDEDMAQAPMTLVARYGEALADQLRDLPGTKLVEVFGAANEEITVTLDAARAAAIGLSPTEVANAISASDAKVSAGQVTGTGDDLTIEVTGEIETLTRLSEIVLREGADGTTLRVADIATLTRGPAQPATDLAYQDGRPAILVAAMPDSGLQVDIWAEMLRTDLETFEQTLPVGMEAALVFDQSVYTADRLSEVGGNMALGIVLVIAVLLITLGLRSALIVAVILPVVTLATLATMNAIGLPIHQMSVTGLIVALGLLVDAGIVMSDDIARRLREGSARLEAVQQAVRRLTMPLFASTITTALSFVPMILLPGPAGDFVGSIAIAVVVMLLWSFAVAVTITPAIAGWVLPDNARSGGIKSGALGRAFRASLRWSVANPIRSLALSLVLPVLGFMSLPMLTAQFFPGVDRDQFHIEVDLPPGTGIARTQDVVERLNTALSSRAEIESVTWTIGRSAPAFYYNITGGRDGAPRYAQALIRTSSAQATEAVLPDLQRTLPTLAPQAQVLVRGLVQGPPVAAPIELRLVGPDVDVLRAEGERLRAIVTAQDAVTLARDSLVSGAPKLSITIDEAAARQVGLAPGDVARQMQAGLTGVTGGSMIEGTEELSVRVRWGDARRADIAAMRDLPLLPPDAAGLAGQNLHPAIPLSAIATLSLEGSDGVITRRNGERVNTIQAFLLRGVLPEEALSDVRSAMNVAGYALPPGYRLEIGGDSDARASTLNNLIAPLGLIITLSIAVVVLTFNSFRLAGVALVVSGLSAGLSMLALALFNYPFGILAIFGLIGSIGVSINAALIIMTALQEDEAASQGIPDAMAEVVMRSSRHIVSTTITTVGGFLPLILAGGGFWPPFAVAIAGGVALSAVVSFYFTPPAFKIAYARQQAAGPKRASHTGPKSAESQSAIELIAAE
ncbi:MAG: efflux RND transporter permease subunit [Pseudomonadota bacterium]